MAERKKFTVSEHSHVARCEGCKRKKARRYCEGWIQVGISKRFRTVEKENITADWCPRCWKSRKAYLEAVKTAQEERRDG